MLKLQLLPFQPSRLKSGSSPCETFFCGFAVAVGLLICLVFCVGCNSKRKSDSGVSRDALALIDYQRVTKPVKELIDLMIAGQVNGRTLSEFPEFAEQSMRGPDRDDGLREYSLMLPQIDEKPFDGSKGVPCWPMMILTVSDTDGIIVRSYLIYQCL